LGSTMEFRFEDHKYPSSVYVTVGSTGGIVSQNTVPHMVPPLITVKSTNSMGTIVNFINSTILYGFKSPICDPKSGSFFSIGQTTVTCAARDQNGNSVIKSFVVSVVENQNQIPLWTKKTVGYWCNGFIDDSQLHSSLQYLASTGVMSIKYDPQNTGTTADKTTLCLWVADKITNQDVSKSLYLLSR